LPKILAQFYGAKTRPRCAVQIFIFSHVAKAKFAVERGKKYFCFKKAHFGACETVFLLLSTPQRRLWLGLRGITRDYY
jgi:hypothetical protein